MSELTKQTTDFDATDTVETWDENNDAKLQLQNIPTDCNMKWLRKWIGHNFTSEPCNVKGPVRSTLGKRIPSKTMGFIYI